MKIGKIMSYIKKKNEANLTEKRIEEMREKIRELLPEKVRAILIGANIKSKNKARFGCRK
jgi:epoxyqueuosine reductase QueG